MRVLVIGALSHLEWDKEEKEKQTNGFWDCAIVQNGKLLSIVDYYKENHSSLSARHTYNTGIVLFNFFHQKGCDTHLINCMADITSDDIEFLKTADVVILSTVYPGLGDTAQNIIRVVSTIRHYNPHCVNVVGGWNIYHLGKHHKGARFGAQMDALKNAGIDILVISRQGLDTLWEKLNNGFRGIIMDEADNTLPAPEMYSVQYLPQKHHGAHTAIITATGCPFDCHFCEYKKLYSKVTYYPLQDVKRLLRALAANRVRPLKHVRFGDECLNYPYSRMMDICRFLEESAFGFTWGCFLRLGNIDDALASAMKSSKCSFASIGMESGDAGIRNTMNKNYANGELERTISLLKKHGVKTIVSLVVGYYGENETTIETTKKVLEQIQPDLVRINIWQPYPHEEETALGRKYGLYVRDGVWTHASMDMAAANQWACYLYRETKGVLFTPPFTSIFDIWPWFVGEGLSENQIIDLIGKYHRESLMSLDKTKPFGKALS